VQASGTYDRVTLRIKTVTGWVPVSWMAAPERLIDPLVNRGFVP
jgi:hypothetical protein